MHNPQCGQVPADIRQHLGDAYRDAGKVYRAILAGDNRRVAEVLNGTGCRPCLTVCAAMIGLALGTRTPADLTDAGWAPGYAAAVTEALDEADADAAAGPWGVSLW